MELNKQNKAVEISGRDRLAAFVVNEIPLPNADPGNRRTFIHDDIVALRYKVPFLPIIGMWNTTVSKVIDNSAIQEIELPDGTFMIMLSGGQGAGNTDGIMVGIDADWLPLVVGDSTHTTTVSVRNVAGPSGPYLTNGVRVLRAVYAGGTPTSIHIHCWTALT